ncbi:type II toxin-antitoxin system RelE/ParE family toxin [bacterium]|nr:type II toxin-antitoxin system RelE/ParE family toxin [bacterium]
MKVIFDELAKRELEDAFEYYECEVPGLGEQFRHEIRYGIRRIAQYPLAWTPEAPEIRRYLIHKFPYKILYSIETDYIFVIAIAHCHRKPEYWIDRIFENQS